MAKAKRSPHGLVQWWHGLPWNGLYWLGVLVLAVGAGFFAVKAEIDLARLVGIEAGDEAKIAEGDTVTVVLILNGDEVVVEKAAHRTRLRMLGIRSFDPVVNEREITAYGQASVRFLEQWVLNKKVQVHFDDPIRDNRGRYLGYLHLGEIDLNRLMVEKGVSMVYTEFKTARESDYLGAEHQARRAVEGIWGGHKAVTRIIGLRRDWSSKRIERDGSAPADPLLEGG